MDIKQAIARVIERRDLSSDDMTAVMRQIMTGEAEEAQIGAFLVALRMKGESLDEITGAVQVMRELATGVRLDDPHAIDIVGTGGSAMRRRAASTMAAASCP